MNIKILSDSTCDLPQEFLDKYNIDLVRLTIVKDGKDHTDGVDITPADIFAHVAAGGDLCTTAALSVGVYQEAFSKYAEAYDAVVHISLGSGFSSSYQNACLAAAEFGNVRVVDSQNLSTGQGHVVLEAARLAQTCTNLDDLQQTLQAYTDKVEASFVLDQLAYMVKGGRCSSATALGANLLSLKPCIEVKGGKMAVVKKYRGNYAKCLTNYVKDRLDGREDIDDQRIFLTHTPVSDEALNAARSGIAQYGSFREVCESVAGCTISCHCGPSTLGILFVRK